MKSMSCARQVMQAGGKCGVGVPRAWSRPRDITGRSPGGNTRQQSLAKISPCRIASQEKPSVAAEGV